MVQIDVQAYDAQLTDVAGLTPSADNFVSGDGTNLGLGTAALLSEDSNNTFANV
ncbi:MAG: hypothetical protein H6625_09650 [Bdellovibrionaceae bacterium]|nr:hypothetical protein [Pseudobdellovibrionaceae bacterium]